MANFKLIVPNVHVYTNLEVRLKSRTMKEQANKEVERMIDNKDLFTDYDWKIDGCEKGGINSFDSKLTDAIVERIKEEETDENIFWDGLPAHYDLNVAHILVSTNLQTALKASTREEAFAEAKVLRENPFEGYHWEIENCDEDSINELNDFLKFEIQEALEKDIEACIKEG